MMTGSRDEGVSTCAEAEFARRPASRTMVARRDIRATTHPQSSCRRQGPPRDQEPADHQAALEAFHRCSLLVNVGEPVFSDIDAATNFRRLVSPAATRLCVR